MFAAMQAPVLALKPSNILPGQKAANCLGHLLSVKDISASTDRINAIRDLPTPTCIKDLRSVVGMAHFVRHIVKDYADLTAPLVELTRKKYVNHADIKQAWGTALGAAFAKLIYFLVVFSCPPLS